MADTPSLSEAGARLTRSAGLRIDDWQAWVTAVTQPSTLIDIAAIFLCGLLAWGVAHFMRHRTKVESSAYRVLLGDRGFDGALFPALWLLLTVAARELLTQLDVPTPLFRIALPALLALLLIRLGARVLRATFPKAQAVLDAPLQMKRETEALRAAAGHAGDSDLEALLGAAASAWPEGQGPAQTLRFEPGRLTLLAPGWSEPQLAQFRERLRPGGWAVESSEGRISLSRTAAPGARS